LIPPLLIQLKQSNIKVGLVVVLHLLVGVADHVLRVEDDVLLLQVGLEEVEFLVVSGVVVDAEEAVLHPQRNVVVLLDGHGRLLLHLAGRRRLPGRLTHEDVVHLLLFFSSILHRLQVPREGRRPPGACPAGLREGDALDLVGRDVVELLDLQLEVEGQVVLLLALAEGVGDQHLLLLRHASLGNTARIPGETRGRPVGQEGRTLEAVHRENRRLNIESEIVYAIIKSP
jgi:hypothetical protein